jgi:hypothetical protein
MSSVGSQEDDGSHAGLLESDPQIPNLAASPDMVTSSSVGWQAGIPEPSSQEYDPRSSSNADSTGEPLHRRSTSSTQSVEDESEASDSDSDYQQVASLLNDDTAESQANVSDETQTAEGDRQPHSHDASTYTLKYQSSGEREEAKGVLFKCPRPDPSIPRTDAAKRVVVKDLIDAISDTTMPRKVDKRWKAENPYYTLENYEDLAWDILEMTVELHKFGWTYRVNDKNFLKTIPKYQNLTFRERMSQIILVLKVSISTHCI